MIMAQSLFKVLKRHRTDCAIDVLAPPWTQPLLACMPEVRSVIQMPVGHGELKLGERRRLGRSVRQEGYQQAIILPGSFKSALIPYWADIPRRTGYATEMRGMLLSDARSLDKLSLLRTVDRFVNLGLEPGEALPANLPRPALSIAEAELEESLLRHQLTIDKPVLALCPGAEYGPAKCWPLEYFAEVAQRKLEQGWQVWLFGSDKDFAAGEQIKQLSEGRAENLCGRTSLLEAAALLSQARAVVSNDSGLMHVAAALDRRVVAVFGSSSPTMTPPLGRNSTVLYQRLGCSPCFKRKCPHWRKAKKYQCLLSIRPEQVLKAID